MKDFNPWLSSALAGATDYTWHEGTSLTLEEENLRREAIEICERRLREVGYDSDALTKLAILLISHLPVEHLVGFFFGLRGEFFGWEDLAQGSVAAVPVSLHVLARRALELDAKLVICAHQHPRGRELPSEADKAWITAVAIALAGVCVQIADFLVIAGGLVYSMAAHRIPLSAWSRLSDTGTTTTEASTRPAAVMSDVDLSVLNRAVAAITRQHVTDYPLSADKLREVAEAWMKPRNTPAAGLLACDVFNRPIACRLIGDDLTTEALIVATQFMIARCAVSAVLIVHSPVVESDLLVIANRAEDFKSMLHPFDVRLVEVLCIDSGGARSLREVGLFHDDSPTGKEAP